MFFIVRQELDRLFTKSFSSGIHNKEKKASLQIAQPSFFLDFSWPNQLSNIFNFVYLACNRLLCSLVYSSTLPHTVLRSYPFYRFLKQGALRLGINDNPERVMLVVSCPLMYSIAPPWSVMLLLAISRLKSRTKNSFFANEFNIYKSEYKGPTSSARV